MNPIPGPESHSCIGCGARLSTHKHTSTLKQTRTPTGTHTTPTQDFQRAIATLAFSPSTKCVTYRALFEASRWELVEQQFMQVWQRVCTCVL